MNVEELNRKFEKFITIMLIYLISAYSRKLDKSSICFICNPNLTKPAALSHIAPSILFGIVTWHLLRMAECNSIPPVETSASQGVLLFPDLLASWMDERTSRISYSTNTPGTPANSQA